MHGQSHKRIQSLENREPLKSAWMLFCQTEQWLNTPSTAWPETDGKQFTSSSRANFKHDTSWMSLLHPCISELCQKHQCGTRQTELLELELDKFLNHLCWRFKSSTWIKNHKSEVSIKLEPLAGWLLLLGTQGELTESRKNSGLGWFSSIGSLTWVSTLTRNTAD